MGDIGHLETLAYVTLFAPLLACVFITVGTLRWKTLSGWLAILAIGGGLGCSILMAMVHAQRLH